MQFRVRPSSKKSIHNNETSLVQFPTSKSLKSAESSLPKIFTSRVDQLEATLSSFQESYRKEREITNIGYIEIQKRLDRLQYKAFSTQQDLRQLSDIREIKPIRESYGNNNDTSKNQIMLLKQVILQDKQALKQNTKHHSAMIEQLSMKQLRTQQELREMIAHQRMEYQYRLTGQGEEIREIDSLKQRKMQQQYEMMKGVISNAQRKIYEELERKIRNETVVKDYIEDKLAELKQELSNQHKQTVSAEAKFIRQTKQSLQSLFVMINSFKKQLSDQLAQTQKLTVNNIKRISTSLDISRQKSADEVKQVSAMQQEINNEMVEIRNFVTTKLDENRQFMSQFEDQTNDRLQQSGVTRKDSTGSTAIDHQKLSLFQKQMNQWKSITEQKNLNVFKEISNTLKTMKLEWRKESDQTVSQVAALNQSLKNLKKSGPNQLKKNVQAIVTIFNNQFDVLAEELQTLTDMIALAKKENQKSLKQEIVKSKKQILEQVKSMLSQKSKQNNLYIDKAVARSEQNTKDVISKQVKYAQDKINQRVQKLESEMGLLQTSFKKGNLLTASQLEDYSVKLKTFNDNYKEYLQEQRKDDMKKRMELEQTMRKNSNNLMDICYKKSEYLVDGLKKNIEISQMKEKVENIQALDNAKDELKKQLQTARQEFQKQLSTGIEKITKQRQNSEQVLHQAIEQSINNTKRNLTNEMGNTKLQLEEKINEMKIKEVQKEAEVQKEMTELKDSLFKMMREQKKLTEESILKNRKEAEDKIQKLSNRFQIQSGTRDQTTNDKIEQINAKIAQLKSTAEKDNKQIGQEKIKQAQLQKKVDLLAKNIDIQYKATNDKIDQISSKILEVNSNVQKQGVKMGEEAKRQAELEKKVQQLNKNVQTDKIIINEEKIKSAEIQKKLKSLSVDFDGKNKQLALKMDEINKKLTEQSSNSEKLKEKDGEGKKVGQESLNKLRTDLEKAIKQIQIKISEIQSKDHSEEQEEQISSIRRSVNKLQAMVFSQQAKNKAIFDRLTQDVNKVSENLSLLTNQMRE